MSAPHRHQRPLRQDKYRTSLSAQNSQGSSDLLTSLFANELVQQLAPLLFVLVVPIFVLLTNKHKRTLLHPARLLLCYVAMVLQTLVGVLPWNWYAGPRERKASETKKPVRTREEQQGVPNGTSAEGELIYLIPFPI